MMAAIPTKILSAAETAAMLRVRLGALRAWRDFLSDCIRDRQGIHGLRLMPCARMHVRGSFRPVYALDDISEFIEAVMRVEPTAGKCPIKAQELMIDRRYPWRLNRFDGDGKPVVLALGSAFA